MFEVIEDFSTEDVKQTIEKWNFSTLVAYTNDRISEATAKQLYKALQKYKTLYFDCEVDDSGERHRIRQAMCEHMKCLYDGVVEIEEKWKVVILFKLSEYCLEKPEAICRIELS